MSSASPSELQAQLVEEIVDCTHDPKRFVECIYSWNKNELVDSSGPRPWQANILQAIGEHLSNPVTRYNPCLISVASGHGVGKSSLVSMCIDWAMSTCEDCKVLITANTGTQLATKTVPEIHKWFRLSGNANWWEMKATSITSRDQAHSKLWRMDAIPWSENNTEAFAGLHNQGKRILLVFDEASAIAEKVWEVAEGALTDARTEIIWLAFGNPTQNTGRFRECFGRFKHRWKTFQIDSRTVEGTNKAQIAKWIEDYGEDSDFVRVRVRGEFPRAGSSQFIPGDMVAACRKYRSEGHESLPKILSVDVARFGDDQTVIGTRQGRKAMILAKYRGLDTVQVAERTIEFIKKEKPDATIIDATGVGAGVFDQVKFRGYSQKLFQYNPTAGARNVMQYRNARSEMWGRMREWLQAGAEIPDDPELESDLTGPEYYINERSQLQIEQKEDMKTRGLSSPDSADMLAMTFQVDVAAPPPPPLREMRYPGQNRNGWMGI